MERSKRDFYRRSEAEQQSFLTQTWCDACQQPDLGMTDPAEYVQGEMTLIEGKCAKCRALIVTELTSDDF